MGHGAHQLPFNGKTHGIISVIEHGNSEKWPCKVRRTHSKPWPWLLVGGIPTPLKNMSSSVGIMKFPIYGKYKIFQTTNQITLKGRMWLVTYRNSRTSRWPDDLAEFRNDFRPNRHRLLWTMEDLPATWHVIYVGHIWGLWVIHGELTQVISHFFHVNPGFIEFINPKTAWLGSYHFKYVKSIRLPMITTIWGLPP